MASKTILLALLMALLVASNALAVIPMSVLSGGGADTSIYVDVSADHCAGQKDNFACTYRIVQLDQALFDGVMIPVWQSGEHEIYSKIDMDFALNPEVQIPKGKALIVYKSNAGSQEYIVADGETVTLNNAIKVTAHVSPKNVNYAKFNLSISSLEGFFPGYTGTVTGSGSSQVQTIKKSPSRRIDDFPLNSFMGYQNGLDGTRQQIDITLDPDAISDLATPPYTDLKFLDNAANIQPNLAVTIPGLEWGLLNQDSSVGFFTSTKQYPVGIYNNHGVVVQNLVKFEVPVTSNELGKRTIKSAPAIVSRAWFGTKLESPIITKSAKAMASTVNLKPVVLGTPVIGKGIEAFGTTAGGQNVQAFQEGGSQVQGNKLSYAGIEEYVTSGNLTFGAPLAGIIILFSFIVMIAVLTKYAKVKEL